MADRLTSLRDPLLKIPPPLLAVQNVTRQRSIVNGPPKMPPPTMLPALPSRIVRSEIESAAPVFRRNTRDALFPLITVVVIPAPAIVIGLFSSSSPRESVNMPAGIRIVAPLVVSASSTAARSVQALGAASHLSSPGTRSCASAGLLTTNVWVTAPAGGRVSITNGNNDLIEAAIRAPTAQSARRRPPGPGSGRGARPARGRER